MDARFLSTKQRWFVSLFLLLASGFVVANQSQAAGARTVNFLIEAPTPQLARTVANAAEKYRHDLAVYWLGSELPPWPTPCPVRVIAGDHLAAQGVTTYNRSPVRDFQMEVVGTPERILDSVLPHEVTHTILATHFGRPLPRWADEGICTTVEHSSERNKHQAKLREFLSNRRGIAMNKLFLMTEYPSDVLPMYAQGYSVCQFLIEQKGAPTFIEFLTGYMRRPSWTENVRKHYGYESLAELQEYWLGWVSQGSGPVGQFAKAGRSPGAHNPMVNLVSQEARASDLSRGQSVVQAPATFPITDPESSMAATGSLSDSSRIPNEGLLRMPRRLEPPNNARPMEPKAASEAALASRSGNGWYQRQKQNAAQVASAPGGTALDAIAPGKRSPAVTPIMPPSVRKSGLYSVSQPQPEMQMSRGGIPPAYPSPRYPVRRVMVPGPTPGLLGGDAGVRGDLMIHQWANSSTRYR